MSYSFDITGNTTQEAVNLVRHELDVVCAGQSVHETEELAVMRFAKSLIQLTHIPEGHALRVSVCGSIWKDETGVKQVDGRVEVTRVKKPDEPKNEEEQTTPDAEESGPKNTAD